MARCEVCGDDYGEAFQVIVGDTIHSFRQLECVIHTVAPIDLTWAG
jgi:hypothetical protein